MREYQELYRVPVPKIQFGGLDTKHSDLFTSTNKSPSMRNIDLRPVGGIRKRDGMADLENDVVGSGTIHQLVPLSSTAGESLYLVQGIAIHLGNAFSATEPWVTLVDEKFITGGRGRSEQAYFVNELASSIDASGWEFFNAAAYIVTGNDRPVIALGSGVVGEQAIAWPEGVYSDSDSVSKRGYPERWKNVDGMGHEDWPKGLFYAGDPSVTTSSLHETSFSRMFAYGFDYDPDRIDYSQLGVPYNMIHANPTAVPLDVPLEDGGFFYCMRGDGDRVVGVRQLSEMTIVFKRKRTFLFQGTLGGDFQQVGILPVGAVSDESIVVASNDIYFWSNDGPRSLSGVIKYGSVNQFSISQDIYETIKSVTPDSKKLITARFENENGRIIWNVGIDDGDTLNNSLVYYLPDGDSDEGRWSTWHGLYCQVPVVAGIYPESAGSELLYGVGSDGRFFLMNTGPTDGGSPIESFYVTRWTDLSVLSIDKRLMNLIVVHGADGVGKSQISYASDYSESFDPVGHRLLSIGEGDPIEGNWDEGNWDDGLVWTSSGNALFKYGLSNLGFIVRFKIVDSSTLGFAISGMALDVSFKGKV